MTEEADLEADVARLREKWLGNQNPLRSLDAEEQAVAARWLGKTEAKKLAETRPGERYRYRPPVVTGHYGYIPATRSTPWEISLGDYWFVEIFRNGRKHTLFSGHRDECLQTVSRLQRMGITVTRTGSERAPEELRPPVTKKPAENRRRAIMEQLRGFKA